MILRSMFDSFVARRFDGGELGDDGPNALVVIVALCLGRPATASSVRTRTVHLLRKAAPLSSMKPAQLRGVEPAFEHDTPTGTVGPSGIGRRASVAPAWTRQWQQKYKCPLLSSFVLLSIALNNRVGSVFPSFSFPALLSLGHLVPSDIPFHSLRSTARGIDRPYIFVVAPSLPVRPLFLLAIQKQILWRTVKPVFAMAPTLTPLILSALILSTAAGPLGYNGERLR